MKFCYMYNKIGATQLTEVSPTTLFLNTQAITFNVKVKD